MIRGLPAEYSQYRERLLKLAYQFGNLDESVRESYSDKSSNYRYDLLLDLSNMPISNLDFIQASGGLMAR